MRLLDKFMHGLASSPADTNLMDILAAANHLGVTKNTLYSWVSQKRIPYVKIGRLVKFDRDDIDAWIESQKIEPYSG